MCRPCVDGPCASCGVISEISRKTGYSRYHDDYSELAAFFASSNASIYYGSPNLIVNGQLLVASGSD